MYKKIIILTRLINQNKKHEAIEYMKKYPAALAGLAFIMGVLYTTASVLLIILFSLFL